jgi:hypothetical protein
MASSEQSADRTDSPKAVPLALGTCFVLIGLTLAWLLVELWPRTVLVDNGGNSAVVVGLSAGGKGESRSVCPVDRSKVNCGTEKKTCTVWLEQTCVLRARFCLTADARLLLLVLLAGAIGSYVHATQSFVSYVGNKKFAASWTWWYILRLPVGAALALLFYFVVRGGLLSAATLRNETGDLNIFGIISFAALAGLFSKQAVDKLSEVFDTLFRTAEDEKRGDKLTGHPKPAIAKVLPTPVPAAGGGLKLTIDGEGFVKESKVYAAAPGAAPPDTPLPSQYENPKRLTATFDPAAFQGLQKVHLWVVNPEPGGGQSDPFVITLG